MATRSERGRRGHRLGLASEARCVWWLRCKGYRVLCRRYKTPVGEIDIVARRGSTLIFVEVKARPTAAAAASAITGRSMARMQRAVEYYVMMHPHDVQANLRLDAMFVTPLKLWPTHLKDSIAPRG